MVKYFTVIDLNVEKTDLSVATRKGLAKLLSLLSRKNDTAHSLRDMFIGCHWFVRHWWYLPRLLAQK